MKQLNAIVFQVNEKELKKIIKEINSSNATFEAICDAGDVRINRRSNGASKFIKEHTDNYKAVKGVDPDVVIYTTNTLSWNKTV